MVKESLDTSGGTPLNANHSVGRDSIFIREQENNCAMSFVCGET